MGKQALVLLVVAACGSSSHVGGDDDDQMQPDAGSGSSAHDAAIDAPPDQLTVFTIVLENQDYAEVVGSANAPYLNSLIAQGTLATQYRDTNHPSLPNYLHMISGADQYPGFLDIGPQQFPYFPANQPNLGSQLDAANIPWRSYQESMPAPCTLIDSGMFAPRHDPFLYFADQQMDAAHCADKNVDYAQLATDLAANTYRYLWITPNLVNDGHDPQLDPVTGLHQCDAWLATEIPKLMASEAYQHGGIIFITWDEAEGRNNDDKDLIPMIVLTKGMPHPGTEVASAFDHGSYLATIEDLFHLPRLATVAATPNLMPMFQ